MSTFQQIRTTRTLAETDATIAALRAAGFHPLDIETASHYTIAGVDISYPITVPSDEADRATEFLQQMDQQRQ